MSDSVEQVSAELEADKRDVGTLEKEIHDEEAENSRLKQLVEKSDGTLNKLKSDLNHKKSEMERKKQDLARIARSK